MYFSTAEPLLFLSFWHGQGFTLNTIMWSTLLIFIISLPAKYHRAKCVLLHVALCVADKYLLHRRIIVEVVSNVIL